LSRYSVSTHGGDSRDLDEKSNDAPKRPLRQPQSSFQNRYSQCHLGLPGLLGAPKLARNSVGSEELAENAVESPEVAQDALTAGDLGAASVAPSEVVDQSLAAIDLRPDSVGSSELRAITVRTNSTSLTKGASGGVSVSCAAGEEVLSGGGQPGHFGTEMTSNRPSGNGWLYQAQNNTGGADTISPLSPSQLRDMHTRKGRGWWALDLSA